MWLLRTNGRRLKSNTSEKSSDVSFFCISLFSSRGGFTALLQGLETAAPIPVGEWYKGSIPTDLKAPPPAPYLPTSARIALTSTQQSVNQQKPLPAPLNKLAGVAD